MSAKKVPHTDFTSLTHKVNFIPSSFLLVSATNLFDQPEYEQNLCEQPEYEQNLCGKILPKVLIHCY